MTLSARSFSCGIATVAVLGIGLSVVIAGPAQAAPSAPSWDDVKAAKSDAADAQQTVDKLSDRLTSLQAAADRAGIVEQQAGQAYALAASQQQEAKDTLADLSAQSKRAKGKADDSAGQVAALVVELSRTGGGDLSTTMLTDASDSGDLLYRVGTMSHLSERSATILAQARSDQKTVDSLADQQSVATTALSKATEATKTAFATANDVSADAQARVQKQQDQQDQVLRQLAYLKGTSVVTESAYWSAQQAKAAETALAAQTSSGGASSNSGGTGTGTSTSPSTGGGSTNASPDTGSGSGSGSGTTTPSRPSTPSKPSTPAAPAPAPAPAKPSTPTPSKPSTPAPSTPAPAPSSPSKAAGAISYARGQLGKPYVLGGAGPSTWDCSGLVMMAYSSQGIATGGHNVVWQYNYFGSIGRLVPLSQRQPGDILFYSSNGTASGGYHDSIYTGNGMMVEAARPGVGVVERAVWTPSQLLPYVARPSGSL
ncbi:cell wall-associated NlpC family hydrolase [Curtobacterium sp. PhB25]|uniref:C40 family peptidase n=1 Tax=Curtobacterium sp. PhB25 TaxID=2485205 RepID=UPI0010668385|nr:C40 family peptidase [Curtobacterium sp. PhB25]TDW67769.1 cell wall-associated NlpC family hydrolase [Curtobacterium sp. PhB25]